jgi:hypothetical protein
MEEESSGRQSESGNVQSDQRSEAAVCGFKASSSEVAKPSGVLSSRSTVLSEAPKKETPEKAD